VAPLEDKEEDDENEVDWMTNIYEQTLTPDINDDILFQI